MLISPQPGEPTRHASMVPDLGPVTPIDQRPSGDPTVDRLLATIFDQFDLDW